MLLPESYFESERGKTVNHMNLGENTPRKPKFFKCKKKITELSSTTKSIELKGGRKIEEQKVLNKSSCR